MFELTAKDLKGKSVCVRVYLCMSTGVCRKRLVLTEEEAKARNSKTVQSAKLLSQFIPRIVCYGQELTVHPVGTFEDERCQFVKVHSELLKH